MNDAMITFGKLRIPDWDLCDWMVLRKDQKIHIMQ
jgi:hypothetical protein